MDKGKKDFKLYPIGTKVYAISRYLEKSKPTNHVGIFKVIIEGIYITFEGIKYT